MKVLTIEGLTVRLAGGHDRDGDLESKDASGCLVVLLHGYGAPGDDLVPLWRELSIPERTRFAFPEAPLTVPETGSGRAWWPIDIMRMQEDAYAGRWDHLTTRIPTELEDRSRQILRCVESLRTLLGLPSERIILGGFSQGALLACDAYLQASECYGGLLMFSGSLIAKERWQNALRKRAQSNTLGPIVMTHGRQDPILPFAIAEQWRDMLTSAGARVDWVAFNGGHTISYSCLDALTRLIEMRSALQLNEPVDHDGSTPS